MEVRKIRSKKIYEQVSDEIRMLIESGELLPGDRLPPLADLADQFGVSRAAIREAITALHGMGLVTVKHGEGTFIRAISMEAVTDPFQAALLLGRGNLIELLEVRQLVEVGIVELAVRRRTMDDVNALSSALFAMETAANRADGVQSELRFHLIMAKATRNSILINIMNVLAETLKSFIEIIWEDGELTPDRTTSMEDHRKLYDAIVAGDAQLARVQVTAHLERFGRWVLERKIEPE